MNKLSFANNFHEIKSIFDGLRTGKEEVVLWQRLNEQVRLVRYAYIEKNHFDQKMLWMRAKNDTDFAFQKGLIYCFIDDQKVVFKSNLGESEGKMLSLHYPEELTLLAANDPMTSDMAFIRGQGEGNINDVMRVKGGKGEAINDIMRVKGGDPFAPDDEKKFGAMRESQRIQPKEDKRVLVEIEGASERVEYKLLDLSQGGAGLLINNPTSFTLKDIVNLIAIDGKTLDKALRGEVVAIRPLNNDVKEFKVGIKFFT